MRRLKFACWSVVTAFTLLTGNAIAQQPSGLQLQKLPVPSTQAQSIATKLSLQYRDVDGVTISPDTQKGELLVMAPREAQQSIARDVQAMLASHAGTARPSGPLQIGLTYITWREFEDELRKLSNGPLPVTTSRNGERAAFQLTALPQNATVEVDRRNNAVTVVAPEPTLPGWQKLIAMLDKTPTRADAITQMMRLENAEPAPIQKALRLLKQLEERPSETETVLAAPAGNAFRNAVFQQEATPGQIEGGADDQGGAEEGGAGVIGDTQIQFVPELGTIIIRGAKRDVERVMEVIRQIEKQSEITKPEVEVVDLNHADANAVASLLEQLYEDVLSARQGEVSITSLDSPNALLLIGRAEAIAGLKELIEKIDQPVAESSRLRVFRLQNASALDAEQTIRDFFTDRPGTGDDLRPGVGPRVRVLADYRTNSLIISASPRDMIEVTRLINDLDVQKISAQNQIKVFQLNNASAEDLAPVIQSAINGDEAANDNLTTPSTTLSIVSVDAENNQLLDSGILAGAQVTADTNGNALVVRAPAGSMALIGELIRQLDRAPGIDSLVKVFAVTNGDALQLTTALTTLFGDEAGTAGTQVGAANLPAGTASASSLVPLRFSTDQRTNSIIASGSAEDLEVVESILLRLDSEGFAERITEVIWLRHQAAADVATALQTYVQQRTQTVNTIQQFQQGLGPYDLPDRDLIVVAEPVSNSILLSVSPRLYEDVRRLIDKLDRRPPMVLMKVMIAEIRLDDAFEIGGEVGLQDSLLFDRGVAASAATNPQSVPGFNFNDAGTPNLNSVGREALAASGVSSFGVGTSNANFGYGGFVLSAASESVSLLLRSLQDAARLQVLSRPQIMTMDNTEGFVQVGRIVARVTDVINNGVAGTQVVTEDLEVGLIMRVRPRVGSDGLIVMDIDATRSDRDDANGTLVPTGDGGVVLINDILQTTAQSVVAAYSGQTVIFGGLIQKSRANFSRRVPIVADIPLVGHFFKYDQEVEFRSELLVILTPMLITGEEDLDYVKQVESSRMSWCLADVVEAHGDVGLSGGYGLWGPAVGNTIYPDLHPTVENVIIQDSYPVAPEVIAPMSAEGAMIDTEVVPVTPGNGMPPTGSSLRPSYTNPLPATSATAPAAPRLPQSYLAPAANGNRSTAQSGFTMPANASQPSTPQSSTAQVSWLNLLEENQSTSGLTNQPTPKPERLGQ
jgi:general secretion pathway protein D